jgi:sugar O-acyltransferase (sialic acid O-acetyltransferase NeuD family)
MTRSSSDERPIYLLGCGGHGRVVLEALLLAGRPVHGILDGALPAGSRRDGVPVLGDDGYLEQLDPRAVALCLGVGVMPGRSRRTQLFHACRARGFEVVSVFHPAASVSTRHQFGVGVQVLAGAVLQVDVRLGDNVIVNTAASVDHDCVVDADVMIGPGAVLCGEVRVGTGAYVGAGAVLLPGVSVGAHAVVGAGSTVTRAVSPGETVAGNPARRQIVADDEHA